MFTLVVFIDVWMLLTGKQCVWLCWLVVCGRVVL